jgi:molybdopterin/thiamine biosynthesis adenylyltransferase
MSKSRYSRQSFLGSDSEAKLAACKIAVVGLGGGGSHVVQQLAHLGFQRYVIYDDDVVEDSNLNRLVGATSSDVRAATAKIVIAIRMIKGLQPDAAIEDMRCKWQEKPEALRECDIVCGCVDSYKAREELEVMCRRYLIHYIDIGMDVHGQENPIIGGQVILSSPDGPCMKCMGFLTDEKLGREAARYGNAGIRPQVVWSNGVLASAAVGLAVDLVTNWTQKSLQHAYLVYNGNDRSMMDSITLRNIPNTTCKHFSPDAIGDPVVVEL